MAEQTTDCEALRTEISTLQAEFEGVWLKVSQGTAPSARYRELRHVLDDLRARYGRECGNPQEDTTLPRSITADWRAG